MKVTQQSRRRVRLQNAIFVILFVGIIGLLAWLTHGYKYEADWTAGARNTLSEASRTLLGRAQGPLRIIAFVPDEQDLHQRIKERIRQYQRYKPDVTLEFVNPDLDPQLARELGVTRTGQIVIQLGERSEHLDDMTEQSVANAIQRLSRAGERIVAFLEGHGERDPKDATNQGMQQLGEVLGRAGFDLQPLSLIRSPQIPSNIRFLVIAAPSSDLLPGEVAVIRDYVKSGGNLLWLQEPGPLHGLEPLARDLGIHFLDGTIVDANADLRMVLGIEHPAVVPVIDFRAHPVTRDLSSQVVFPIARGIQVVGGGESGWTVEPMLVTLSRTWSETGSLQGDVQFEPEKGDVLGPLNIGVSLRRPEETPQEKKADTETAAPAREQRIAVIGDSDFLANSFVGVGSNLDLGNNLFNWLAEDDQLISIRPKSAPDTELELSNTAAIVIGAGFLVVLPVGLIAAGLTIWLRRRKR